MSGEDIRRAGVRSLMGWEDSKELFSRSEGIIAVCFCKKFLGKIGKKFSKIFRCV